MNTRLLLKITVISAAIILGYQAQAQQAWAPFPYMDYGFWKSNDNTYNVFYADSFVLDQNLDTTWLIGANYYRKDFGTCTDSIVDFMQTLGPNAGFCMQYNPSDFLIPNSQAWFFARDTIKFLHNADNVVIPCNMTPGTSLVQAFPGQGFDSLMLLCTHADTATLFGQLDSVKYFTLSYRLNGAALPNLPSHEFVLSKAHGFVQYSQAQDIVQKLDKNWVKQGYYTNSQQYGIIGSDRDYAFRPCVGDVYLWRSLAMHMGGGWYEFSLDTVVNVVETPYYISYELRSRYWFQSYNSPHYTYHGGFRNLEITDSISNSIDSFKYFGPINAIKSALPIFPDWGLDGPTIAGKTTHSNTFDFSPSFMDTVMLDGMVKYRALPDIEMVCGSNNIVESYNEGYKVTAFGLGVVLSRNVACLSGASMRDLYAFIRCGEQHGTFPSYPLVSTEAFSLPTFLKVFPNPVQAQVNIQLDQLDYDVQLEILNVYGQTMLVQQLTAGSRTTQLDVNHLSPGLYVVNLRQPDGKQLLGSQSFIKQ